MNTITAQEIKRRGISAVDDALRKGPVHIIKNNKPSYVVLAEEQFNILVEEGDTLFADRIRESLKGYQKGRVKKYPSVEELMKDISS